MTPVTVRQRRNMLSGTLISLKLGHFVVRLKNNSIQKYSCYRTFCNRYFFDFFVTNYNYKFVILNKEAIELAESYKL